MGKTVYHCSKCGGFFKDKGGTQRTLVKFEIPLPPIVEIKCAQCKGRSK